MEVPYFFKSLLILGKTGMSNGTNYTPVVPIENWPGPYIDLGTITAKDYRANYAIFFRDAAGTWYAEDYN